jgi:hypothetical protein
MHCRILARFRAILTEGEAEKRTCLLIQNFLDQVCPKAPRAATPSILTCIMLDNELVHVS